MNEKNIAESVRLKRAIKARRQQCYYNAVRVIWEVPDYRTATYVEGVAVSKSLYVAIEHGWIERDGTILDPTLPNDDITYFAGLRFEGERGIAEGMKLPKRWNGQDDLPFFYRYGWSGGGVPRAAWSQAFEFIELAARSRA